MKLIFAFQRCHDADINRDIGSNSGLPTVLTLQRNAYFSLSFDAKKADVLDVIRRSRTPANIGQNLPTSLGAHRASAAHGVTAAQHSFLLQEFGGPLPSQRLPWWPIAWCIAQ
jgi:hypothetical protein